MLKKLAAAALLTVLTTLGVSSAAIAGTENCSAGYSCLWSGTSYDGSVYGTARNATEVADWLREDGESASANGASCKSTRFYDKWSWVSGAPAGSYFTLDSKTLVGSNYRDPNLANGVGYDGAGINWANKVGAVKHVAC